MSHKQTSNAQFWITEFRKNALERIQAEEAFCKEEKDNKEKLENRLIALNLYWLLGEDILDTIVYKKSNGPCKAKDDSLIKLFVEKTNKFGAENCKEQIERLIRNYEEAIKLSQLKEKWWRYAYNLNLAKAIKYHSKLHNLENETIEKMNEDITEGTKVVLMVDERINKKEDTQDEGESAYLKFCNNVKKCYEDRKMLLKSMVNVLKEL